MRAGRLNQLPPLKLVEPARERPLPETGWASTWASSPWNWLRRHVNVLSLKLVEPGRDEGAARVETIRQPNSRPVEEATSCPGYSGDARGSSGAKW